jgi:hypothetical protein
MIHCLVAWMSGPVERSITVSAPHSVAQRSLSTSASMLLTTAELPMLALIFTWNARPIAIGSSSGWLMLAGMIARPRATSLRTNSAGIPSRIATNSISGVISPRRAKCIWVTGPVPRSAGRRSEAGIRASVSPARFRPVTGPTRRAATQSRRSAGRPTRGSTS